MPFRNIQPDSFAFPTILDIQGFQHQNIKKYRGKNLLLKWGLIIWIGWLVLISESSKDGFVKNISLVKTFGGFQGQNKPAYPISETTF